MRKLALTVLAALAVAAGCNDRSGLAYGDYTSIIAAMDSTVWEQVRDTMRAALEPTIRTVSDERTFTVTYQNPQGKEWGNLRKFRQMLLVGTGDESWMQDALAKTQKPVNGPGIYHAYDVWAREQQVTLILAPAGQQADAVRADLVDLNATLDKQFREYTRNRMFLSGMDSTLTDTLRREAGFSLLVPNVYTWEVNQDSIYTFRNDQPDPSELIRQVSVTWRTPIPAQLLTPDEILKWRADVAATYGEPQDVDVSNADESSFEYQGNPGYRIQAIWRNPPELNWPAAGPFITRIVTCPQQDRVYLLDAWLYAPGKEKYEYMLQLQTILDSFRCGAS